MAILNLRLLISIWLNHHLGTENYRTDISFSEVLKWLHNMWIQSPLKDLKSMLKLKGSATQLWEIDVREYLERESIKNERKKEHLGIKCKLMWSPIVVLPLKKKDLSGNPL